MAKFTAMQRAEINIRRLINTRGLKQNDIAELIGEDHSNFSKKLRGVQKTNVEWYEAVAAAMGVDISEIFAVPQFAEKVG
jgi:transcriptional regulator with XRE-family HTH domain